jgi:hypothetical protein
MLWDWISFLAYFNLFEIKDFIVIIVINLLPSVIITFFLIIMFSGLISIDLISFIWANLNFFHSYIFNISLSLTPLEK